MNNKMMEFRKKIQSFIEAHKEELEEMKDSMDEAMKENMNEIFMASEKEE